MIPDRTEARRAAAARAVPWLESLNPETPDATSLRGLGLMCCENLLAGTALYSKTGRARVRLPPPARFVTMDRSKLAALCGAISRSVDRERPLTGRKGEFWSEMFGAMAQSYARAGDISTAAALLRSAAQLGLSHAWLAQCETFLLDQQAPEGNFGLISRELTLVHAQKAPWLAQLNLTVEILWALAEVSALEAVRSDSRGSWARRPPNPTARTSAPAAIGSPAKLNGSRPQRLKI